MDVGIGSTFARNITTLKGWPQPFWGRYEELNNVVTPSISAIQAYQLQKIKQFEEISASRMEKYARINKLFSSGNVNKLQSEYAENENNTIDQAITNIIKAINGTYQARTRIDKNQYEYDYQKLQDKLKNLRAAINSVNKMLKSEQTINKYFLDQIDNAIEKCGIESSDPSQWFKMINQFKGDIVEEIGLKWLNSFGVSNIKTLNVGSLSYQGSSNKGRHKGQLIQDLMILQVDDFDLDMIPIEYKFNKEKKIVTLKEFIEKIETMTGESEEISITDETYDILESLSIINIQGKGGLNQIPWNKNSKNTQISIEELENDGLTISAKRTLELLHQLDCENIPKKDIWVKNTSRDYNLIADYGLATKLFKVLHLDNNQYVLTPQGFTPFSTRIETMMKAKNSRIAFKGLINIGANENDAMGKLRAIYMPNYK